MESTSVIGIWGALEQADKAATLAINSINSPVTDFIWKVFSNIPAWIPLYIGVVVFLYIKLGWKKASIFTLCCILTVLCCDQFGNVCKDFFERLRPCHDPYMLDSGLHIAEKLGGKYGFYSAHAANSMGFALCSSIGFKQAGRARGYSCAITIWALLVAISRVFVGKHFLGDVIVGAAVGAVIAFAMASLGKYAIKRLKL